MQFLPFISWCMWLPGEIQVRKIEKNRADVHVGEVSNLIWNMCRSFVACCSFMISNFKASCEGPVKFTHLYTFIYIYIIYSSSWKKNSYESNAIPKRFWHAEFCMIPHQSLLATTISLEIKASFGAFHRREGAVTSASFKIWNVLDYRFSRCQSLRFPTVSSIFITWNHKRFREKRFRDGNLRVAIPKQGPLMKWAMTKDLHLSTLIYHYLYMSMALTDFDPVETQHIHLTFFL